MIPETFPVIVVSDLHVPDLDGQYETATTKTTVGWLKSLYLWRYDGEYMSWTQKDVQEYVDAALAFKKCVGIGRNDDLHDWEENTGIREQVKMLNKFRLQQGYTEVVDRCSK